jgi:glucosamine 6-phosphate synthetase-like amidotransferase/phosphosugar isomerase protein
MLCTLLRLAGALAELRGDAGELMAKLAGLPGQVAATLRDGADVCAAAAGALLPAGWVAFLGAGPNEATARFGAAKLFEGSQRLGVATSIEEWAHEQYFVTSAGDPVVLVNPSGAGYDRGAGYSPTQVYGGQAGRDQRPLARRRRGARRDRGAARRRVRRNCHQ